MTRKRRLLIYTLLMVSIYSFFIFALLNAPSFWPSSLFIFLFASGIAITVYWHYHFGRSDKHEKQRMISQKDLNRYYYDRWYTPADSTLLEHETEKIKRRKQIKHS